MKIYLAGPDVFSEDPVSHGKWLKKMCAEYGHEGIFPLDGDPDVNPTSKEIFEANFNLIKQCDVVLANMQPFRGPSMDVGTAWEMGAAKALGKKVILYNHPLSEYKHRAKGTDDFPTVEDFGLADNLMLIHGADGVYGILEEALMHMKEYSD